MPTSPDVAATDALRHPALAVDLALALADLVAHWTVVVRHDGTYYHLTLTDPRSCASYAYRAGSLAGVVALAHAG